VADAQNNRTITQLRDQVLVKWMGDHLFSPCVAGLEGEQGEWMWLRLRYIITTGVERQMMEIV
jgi:hypothetical protein